MFGVLLQMTGKLGRYDGPIVHGLKSELDDFRATSELHYFGANARVYEIHGGCETLSWVQKSLWLCWFVHSLGCSGEGGLQEGEQWRLLRV